MGEPVGELAVVGQQDQAGGVGVEAPHRVEAPLRVDELDHGRAPARLARRRHHPGRLVDDPDLARLGRYGPPVDLDAAGLVDVAGRVA